MLEDPALEDTRCNAKRSEPDLFRRLFILPLGGRYESKYTRADRRGLRLQQKYNEDLAAYVPRMSEF